MSTFDGCEVVISQVAGMDSPVAGGFYTPPNARRTKNAHSADQDLGHLITLHKMGIITREELRAKVLKWDAPNSVTSSPPVVTTVKISPSKRRIVDLSADNEDANNEDASRVVKKKRLGKPEESVANLRQYVRNPTRRRFFKECCDANSLLWSLTPSGTETMHKVLFQAGAQDPMNIIYAEHPGQTRSIKSTTMMKMIKWQVRKDRANYKGRQPKRQICFGSQLTFDWAATLASINAQSLPNNLTYPSPSPTIQTVQHQPINPSPSPTIQTQTVQHKPINPSSSPTIPSVPKPTVTITEPEPVYKFDLDLMMPCHDCGIAVWIGPKADVPSGTALACPPEESDWSAGNVEPYCDKCWEAESKLLNDLSTHHKAIGMKKKNTPQQKKETPKPKKKTPKPKKKSKPKKKKSLGGVQGSLITEPARPRWQVRVRTQHTQSKQIGVFKHHCLND